MSIPTNASAAVNPQPRSDPSGRLPLVANAARAFEPVFGRASASAPSVRATSGIGEAKRGQRWVDFVLANSPAQLLFRWSAERTLVTLAYHDVVDVARFRAQMLYVKRFLNIVSAADVGRARHGEAQLPERAALITFDDGDRTVYEVALPILRELGIPAVAFVVAGSIDGDEPFWWVEVEDLFAKGGRYPGKRFETGPQMVRWIKGLADDDRLAVIRKLRDTAGGVAAPTPHLRCDELLQMQSQGIEIGNHTWSHPCLNQCDAATVEREVVRSHEWLTEILGRSPRLFAYPGGYRHVGVPQLLRSLGYRAGFLFDHRISRVPPDDPLAISRVRVNSTTSQDRFRMILSGLHPFVHRLRGRS